MIDKVSLIIRYIEILNEWESNFIQGINAKLVANKDTVFSDKQVACLDKIHTSILKSIEIMRNKRNGKKKNEYKHEQLEY